MIFQSFAAQKRSSRMLGVAGREAVLQPTILKIIFERLLELFEPNTLAIVQICADIVWFSQDQTMLLAGGKLHPAASWPWSLTCWRRWRQPGSWRGSPTLNLKCTLDVTDCYQYNIWNKMKLFTDDGPSTHHWLGACTGLCWSGCYWLLVHTSHGRKLRPAPAARPATGSQHHHHHIHLLGQFTVTQTRPHLGVEMLIQINMKSDSYNPSHPQKYTSS